MSDRNNNHIIPVQPQVIPKQPEVTLSDFRHQCDVCKEEMQTVDGLFHHITVTHGIKPGENFFGLKFKCTIVVDNRECRFASYDIEKFKDHLTCAHTHVRFCGTCGAGYSSLQYLHAHYRDEEH